MALVKYQDGTRKRSQIPILTEASVEQLYVDQDQRVTTKPSIGSQTINRSPIKPWSQSTIPFSYRTRPRTRIRN